MTTTEPSTVLNRDIADLPISTLARNALRRAGIDTVARLLAQPDDRLLLVPNFGARSLLEVKRALRWCDLTPPPPRLRDLDIRQEVPP